ncbi:YdcF family protein [Natroniella sulfidigena]|uniref:YdcF family protein n=1 Tax=Natroniella sulfidigena TaxID=723921 RepID=UPI00200B607D|nr:YdcF family protein [Natroniella sulfidigena]MCK8816797.1 YdcF family protein [Natroniella sulfidigena]
MDFFIVKFLSSLLLPPGLFILLLLISLLFLHFKRKEFGLTLKSKIVLPLVVLLAMIYILSSYWGETLLVRPLEERFSPITEEELFEREDTVIVVLGGGVVRGTPQGEEIGKTTLTRLYGGWQLHNQTGFDLAVSGGVPPGVAGLSEAEIMRDVLVDWGVGDQQIITEGESLNTWLNAANTTALLSDEYDRIILVTSATHMRRSIYSFREHWEGELVAAPVDYTFDTEISLLRFIPNRFALDKSLRAVHEWLGLVWYYFKA